MRCPEYVRLAIDKLEECGYEAFVVGGSLRDMLLGRTPDDFDIATSATPKQTLSVFSDFYTIPTGLKHGTVTVMVNSHPLEITTYRIDGEYCDSRHPREVSFTSRIEEDLSRRDFTVNAMAYNDKRGLVDVFGGKADLQCRVLCAVGDAELRMKEDALRIMRALRFSAQLSFTIEENTYLALSRCAPLLANISGERKGVELIKLLVANEPQQAVRDMIDSGVWGVLCPDFSPSERSVAALSKVESTPIMRLATLLFDCDSDTARSFLASLKYSNAIIGGVLKILDKSTKSVVGDADIRRFIIRYGDMALGTARVAETLGEGGYPSAEDVLRVQSENFCRTYSDLAVGGDRLLEIGFRGREIGTALERLFDIVLDDPAANSEARLMSELQKIKMERVEDGKNN